MESTHPRTATLLVVSVFFLLLLFLLCHLTVAVAAVRLPFESRNWKRSGATPRGRNSYQDRVAKRTDLPPDIRDTTSAHPTDRVWFLPPHDLTTRAPSHTHRSFYWQQIDGWLGLESVNLVGWEERGQVVARWSTYSTSRLFRWERIAGRVEQ